MWVFLEKWQVWRRGLVRAGAVVGVIAAMAGCAAPAVPPASQASGGPPAQGERITPQQGQALRETLPQSRRYFDAAPPAVPPPVAAAPPRSAGAGALSGLVPGAAPPPMAMARRPAAAFRAPAAADARATDERERQIFYATNRRPRPPVMSGDLQAVERDGLFDNEPAGELSFGSLVIRAPACRQVGEVNRPREYGFWHYTIYREPTDPERHFTLRRVQSYATAEEFSRAVGRFGERSAILFVHGFRNAFMDAAFHLAQIVYDMDYAGVPVLFSWPAENSVFDYWHDHRNAEASRAAFMRVLRLLRDSPALDEVHVIAHSMGNHVVLDALAGQQEGPGSHGAGELIMAAPDVDGAHYADIAARIRGVTKGMTLYASAEDFALKASRLANRTSRARAGDVPGDGPIIVTEADTVDVSALGELFSLNHTAFSVSPVLIADMKQLVQGRLHPPDLRKGPFRREVEPSGRFYWRHLGAAPAQASECQGSAQ